MANPNKLFTSKNIPRPNQVSKMRINREYLLSDNVAKELNTYLNFGIFRTFNDVYKHTYDEKGKEISTGNGPGTPGVRSIFNRSGAVLVGTSTGNVSKTDIYTNASEIRISNNIPLMDSPENRRRIRKDSGCSVKELVEASSCGMLGREVYSYADFMYCKHLGKISNNHLITLRRFPMPVGDTISSLGEGKTRMTKEGGNNINDSIGCMVTWMGTPGNEMGNLLKYSYKMPFKEKDAQWNDIQGGQADTQGGFANGIAAAFDPTYRKQYMKGMGGNDLSNFINKFYRIDGINGPYNAQEEMNWRDENKVYGPVDAVKKTFMRSEDGIQFDQTFNITFDYELRSYNGINGKQAMLDLLSNILNVTYTTGDFWGGGYIGAGQHQNSLFANMKVFKSDGGMSGMLDGLFQDCGDMWDSVRNALTNRNIWSTIKSTLNELGGMAFAGLLNKLGRPAKMHTYSLLSEAPVGFWHLTIGNPFHPILSAGNLVLTNTTVEHYGPLGLDDFPTGIKVTCELTRGKPRDIREIEKMYMHGSDKILFSMGPKVLDMYKNSEKYKKGRENKMEQQNSNYNTEIPTGQASVNGKNNPEPLVPLSAPDLKKQMNILLKTFGRNDSESIVITAKEQDFGSQPKKTKK